ncbi:MAG TPA: MGMT family protein [Solimonas sp.]|nr:MGMT family protein [Solimonas sp.]
MTRSESYKLIWAVVRRIPRGKVATYGQVAALAGFTRQPRLAGHALGQTPDGMKLPWYRVINAQGKISLPPNTKGAREQRRLLADEGVAFMRGRVDLERYRWRPRSEAPLLD